MSNLEEISPLTTVSLTDDTIETLNSNGIYTLKDYLEAPWENIVHLTGLTRHEYEVARDEFKEYLAPVRIRREVQLFSPPAPLMPTGIKKLDYLLQGGMRKGDILEFYGQSGTGKTTLCHFITAQFAHVHSASVLYFDFKNELKIVKLIKLANSRNFLTKLRIVKEGNLNELIGVLEYIEKEVSYGQSRFCEKLNLIVIDSLPMPFYPLLNKKGPTGWNETQKKFGEYLQLLASRYGFCIVLVNHAVAVYNGNRRCEKAFKPALGFYWLQIPSIRIQLERLSQTRPIFRAKVMKSPLWKENKPQIDFTISNKEIA